MQNNKLIIILGPTASGKSDLAIKLAQKFNGEIISADSRQIYKEMNIGTAKIIKKEMSGVPHYMIDIVKPNQKFTLAQFQEKTIKIIKNIQKRNKLPLLVGGTGLYIQSIVDNLKIPETKPDKKLRNKLEKLTNQELINKLKKLDSKALKIIDTKNKRRLIRALEIIIKTRKPVPLLKKQPLPYPVLMVGIKKQSDELKCLIKKRLLKRFKEGMVLEVKKLRKSSLSWQRLEEFGLEYRYIAQYLQKKLNYKELVERLQKEIEHFTKRQMTWFKKDKRIRWIKNQKEAEKLVKEFLK